LSFGYEALGSADITSEAPGLDSIEGSVLGTDVLGNATDGFDVPAGVLHAAAAPPSVATRAKAIRILFNIGLGFLR
jgi:hypothetical protein